MRIPGIGMGTLCSVLLVSGLQSPAQAAREEPGPPQQGVERRLTLEAAIDLALSNNYDLLLAQERQQESRGAAFTRLGPLLPGLSGTSDYRRLKTFQGEFGGAPQASTARDIWDSRARLTQSIFSLSLIQQWQGGRVGVEIADLEADIARRDTIATAALLYYDALRAVASVTAREASLELSRRLWTLTEGRKRAGAATGIDVIRANIQFENERRLLLEARNERNRAMLQLIRAMGIPGDARIVLVGSLEVVDVEEHTANEAVAAALRNRAEVEAQAQRLRLAGLTLDSTISERIPSVDFRGDYGLIGEDGADRVSTYSVGAFLSWPFYDGQREGRISERRSQLRQVEIQARDVIHQVSVEAREANQTLRLSRQQSVVAQVRLGLALEQLRLSHRAFSIGTLTHLEVISAQIAAANAREDAVQASFDFLAARVNLARARGQMDRIYSGRSLKVEGSFKGGSVHHVQAVWGPPPRGAGAIVEHHRPQ